LAVKREVVRETRENCVMGVLRDLHASPNAINVIKSRKMMGAGHENVWGRREMQTAL
jgi:hypothetical protein